MRTVCAVCKKLGAWIDAPTGGWWRHTEHPEDEHDFVPTYVTSLSESGQPDDVCCSVEQPHNWPYEFVNGSTHWVRAISPLRVDGAWIGPLSITGDLDMRVRLTPGDWLGVEKIHVQNATPQKTGHWIVPRGGTDLQARLKAACSEAEAEGLALSHCVWPDEGWVVLVFVESFR